MSYTIIKSIVIKDGKVIIRGSCSNVTPKRYDPEESRYFTRLLQEEGMEALDLKILRLYEEGSFQRGANKWTRALQILRKMPEYPHFDWRRHGIGVEYDVVCEMRKSEAFTALLKKALASKLPSDKYVITKEYGCGTVYLNRAGRHAKFVFDNKRAKVFHYRQDAEDLKSCYSGSDDWKVVPANAAALAERRRYAEMPNSQRTICVSPDC